MEHLSYKGGCDVCECAHIETFKRELGWAIYPVDKRLRLIVKMFKLDRY